MQRSHLYRVIPILFMFKKNCFMNKKTFIASAVFALLLTACNSTTTTTDQKDSTTAASKDTTTATAQETDKGMAQPISAMMDRMKAVTLTGDIDNDFAMLMMEHHQGAVDISEMEAAKGSDSVMTAMARTMIADHKAEIEQLKSFSSNHTAMHKNEKEAESHEHEDGEETDLADAMKAEMHNMTDLKSTGNADRDYAMLMQAHHEAAVKMSKAEIAHGHHAKLKKMAKKMRADDEKEIKKFKEYLAGNK